MSLYMIEGNDKNLIDWTWDTPDEDITKEFGVTKEEGMDAFDEDSFLEPADPEELDDKSTEQSEEPEEGNEATEDPVESTVDSEEGLEEPEEEPEEAPEEDKEVDEVPREELFKSIALDLQDSGIDLGVGEDDTIDDTEFFDRMYGFIDNSVKSAIDAWQETLDPEAKRFNKFINSGGTPDEYYKTVGAGTWRNISLDGQAGQEEMVKHYLSNEEQLSEEEIEAEVDSLISADLLEKKAQHYRNRLEKKAEREAERITAAQEKARQEAEQAQAERLKALKQKADEIKEVKGMPISGRKAFDFISKNTEKAGDRYVPKFYTKLNEVLNDPEQALLLSELLRNDFDFSAFEQKATTKATKRTRKLIEQTKNKSKSRTSPSDTKPVWEVGAW